ncbi:MAG: proton-conducting membrane transporter [Clostridiales bacterium]|nr:proton-conducting membrane transporter [Clostridiales bacterium]
MKSWFILVPILLPILAGILLLAFPIEDQKKRNICIEIVVLLNTVLTFWLLLHRPEQRLYLFSITNNMPLTLHIDGLSMLFGGLVAFLWPLASLYAFEYMRHEERVNTFMAFYTITYGVTLGVAFSGNIVTMYLFYEMLTLVTLPLVIHTMTKEAWKAARKYLYYMIGGTAFAFIGIVFYSLYCNGNEFILGGNLNLSDLDGNMTIVLIVYVLAFYGFGVKAAVFPFHGWLPSASVAPTPVTALLHAVAVVKAGVFAIMRLTYYCFGPTVLKGTWAQTVVVTVAIVTIIYGSTMGVRETHFKRRLAYSTISNLSYILLGVTMMSTLGLVAGLCHMFVHAIMKISGFFCAGAVMHQTDKNYIYELDGLGYAMPLTFTALLISGLSLTGVPLFAGFVSKWSIVEALFHHESMIAYIGLAALLYSALMTGIYMLPIAVRAWFPRNGYHKDQVKGFTDPNWMMKVPLFIFSVITVGIGLYAQPLYHFIENIATGVL